MSTAYAYQFRVDNYASERGRLEVQLALRQVTSTEYGRKLEKLVSEHGRDARDAYETDKADRQREAREAAEARAAKEADERRAAEEAIATERNGLFGSLAPAFDPNVRGPVSPIAFVLARGNQEEAAQLDQLHRQIVDYWHAQRPPLPDSVTNDKRWYLLGDTRGKDDSANAWLLIMASRQAQ